MGHLVIKVLFESWNIFLLFLKESWDYIRMRSYFWGVHLLRSVETVFSSTKSQARNFFKLVSRGVAGNDDEIQSHVRGKVRCGRLRDCGCFGIRQRAQQRLKISDSPGSCIFREQPRHFLVPSPRRIYRNWDLAHISVVNSNSIIFYVTARRSVYIYIYYGQLRRFSPGKRSIFHI